MDVGSPHPGGLKMHLHASAAHKPTGTRTGLQVHNTKPLATLPTPFGGRGLTGLIRTVVSRHRETPQVTVFLMIDDQRCLRAGLHYEAGSSDLFGDLGPDAAKLLHRIWTVL